MAIIKATEVNAVRGARGGGSTALNFGDEKIESSAQEFSLGQRGQTPDGRVFRYAKNSSAALTTSGNLLDGIALVAAHDMDVPCTGTTAAGETDLSLEVPTTDLTLNQYAGGYVIINDGPGIGEVYRISSHPAHDASADATCVFTLDEPTVTQTTTSSLVGLVYSPYKDVKAIDGDGTMTTGPLGVNPAPVTASYYFWLQTSGISSVLAGAAVGVVGDGLKVSQASGETGAADLFDTSTNQDTEPIGTATGIPSVATDNQIVNLSIKD
tara:strand:+ start:1070 stop:1873 length:804 start_codon:yes stop_codon:yes gene_type:complete